jgi:hypothetical protein
MDQSILYVDIENLLEIAQETLLSVIQQWPPEFPRPKIIKLFVRADQVELWKIWTGHHIPSIEIQVKGVQHYTYSGAKNSADLALALDVITDLLKDRTKYVTIISDDSDYAALFTAIKQEVNLAEVNKVPFKWIMTNRQDTRSSLLTGFFPDEYIYTVPIVIAPIIPGKLNNKRSIQSEEASNENEIIAKTVIQNLPTGSFKSSDCKKIIVQYYPKHQLAKLDSAQFGTVFSKEIWPILQKYGVQLSNPNRKPRKYENTDESKSKAV